MSSKTHRSLIGIMAAFLSIDLGANGAPGFDPFFEGRGEDGRGTLGTPTPAHPLPARAAQRPREASEPRVQRVG